MRRISVEKRMPRYHKIYEQMYENPTIPIYQMTKSTGISRSTISRYLAEMYELSIIKGPMVFVKQAQNYAQYASFLRFDHPFSAYRNFKGFPHVISKSLCCGSWNLMLICERFLNFSLLKEFKKCIHQGIKGGTFLSKVSSLDWETSVERMYSALSSPKEKSSLGGEIPHNPWKEEEWALYHKFKYNMRILAMPVLKECGVRFDRYQTWFSRLQQFATVQTAFYPQGMDKYFLFDFLFKTEYQKNLVNILGMLPSTSIFFSVGEYVLARLALLTKKEKDDLFTLIYQLGEEDFYTDSYQTAVISTSNGGV